jgi:hypothetical protein
VDVGTRERERQRDAAAVDGYGGCKQTVGAIHPDTHQPYRWQIGYSPLELDLPPLPTSSLASRNAGTPDINGIGCLHGYHRGLSRSSISRT